MAKTTFAKKKPEDYDEFENEIEKDSGNDLDVLSDNADSVPLFADSDGRSLRSIAYLKLSKLEEKGWAYKGQIPLSSTNETIGQLYGDGVYTIEGCNKKHKVLDTKENIRISLGYDSPKERQLALASVAVDNTAEFDRIERLATTAGNESKELSKIFTTMVTTQAEASIAREMEFMKSMLKGQTDFMSGMMLMQAQGFQQTMAIMSTGHAQNIQQLKTSMGDKEKAPGVKEMMELFMSGINVARDLNEDNDEDEELPLWQEILQGGFGILGSLAKSQLPANATGANPAPAEPAKIRSSVLSPRDVKKRKILEESLRLRALVRSSGLSMAEVARRLKAESPAPDSEPEEEPDTEEDENEEDDDSSDSFESEESERASGTN